MTLRLLSSGVLTLLFAAVNGYSRPRHSHLPGRDDGGKTISLRIVLFLTGLLVAMPAGGLWALPIQIVGGSAFNTVADGIVGLDLVGDRGFSLTLSQESATFTAVTGIPINLSPGTGFSGAFGCCARPDSPGHATLGGNSYVVGNDGTASFAAVSVTTPTVSLPSFDPNCVGPCGAVITLPASLTGTFTHSDAGQPTTEILAGQGIAQLGLEQRPAASGFPPGPGLAWQRPGLGYTFGVSPDLADSVWRDLDGDLLQATPEPATLVLWGTGAAGLGVARWLRRRRT
jgi:hypothetical protein